MVYCGDSDPEFVEGERRPSKGYTVIALAPTGTRLVVTYSEKTDLRNSQPPIL